MHVQKQQLQTVLHLFSLQAGKINRLHLVFAYNVIIMYAYVISYGDRIGEVDKQFVIMTYFLKERRKMFKTTSELPSSF